MSENKEELKNKILYRASYRGTKEMDILMNSFVKSLINDLDIKNLKELDILVNMDDESLQKIKKNKLDNNFKLTNIITKFQDFKI